jgi:hypothetical protein
MGQLGQTRANRECSGTRLAHAMMKG